MSEIIIKLIAHLVAWNVVFWLSLSIFDFKTACLIIAALFIMSPDR